MATWAIKWITGHFAYFKEIIRRTDYKLWVGRLAGSLCVEGWPWWIYTESGTPAWYIHLPGRRTVIADSRHSARSALVQRRRRWTNNERSLCECPVWAGIAAGQGIFVKLDPSSDPGVTCGVQNGTCTWDLAVSGSAHLTGLPSSYWEKKRVFWSGPTTFKCPLNRSHWLQKVLNHHNIDVLNFHFEYYIYLFYKIIFILSHIEVELQHQFRR